jgi:hypothetical protein
MPYCRRCGAELEETAKFCHVCGTPVAPVTATQPAAPKKSRPAYLLPVAILVAVLLTALVISALFFVPFYPVNFNQTNEVSKANVDNLLVDFQADVADVNIIFQNLPGSMVVLNVTAIGNVGILTDADHAVNVTFNHQTANNSVVVVSSVSQTARWSVFSSLKVDCDVYIDPSANVDLNFHSEVGRIMMDADTKMTLQKLDLETTTGSIDVSLSRQVTVTGSISIKSTTGSVHFIMDDTDVLNGASVNLQSTTGVVNLDLTATQSLLGNVTVNARTTTGAVNLFMVIDNGVGARIESATDLGRIHVDVQRFSGNQTPLQSNNYPAESNFLVELSTNTGAININADYGSSTILS